MNRTIPKLALLLVLLMSTFGMNANPIDMRIAQEVAVKFMNANTQTPLRGTDDLQLVTTYNISRGDAAFYVFNTPRGFVIVSADDCATPILGYSDEGQFNVDNIPIQLQDYLQDFLDQITYGIENNIQPDEATAHQWELARTVGHLIEQRATTVVDPLVTSNWGQNCNYNYYCPIDENGHCNHAVVGCVATSFAQILHYWGYPSVGTGSHTYTPYGYPTQTVNFGATIYDWAHMPNTLLNSPTTTEIKAVATLMWHCGVAVDMQYGPSSSGADFSNVESSLVDYFGYSDELSLVSRSDYSDEEWLNMMKNCLDLGRPIHYTGNMSFSGHAFVCDGYDSNDLLHFNWGWNGINNGYYALGALNPGAYSFNSRNKAIINIHPKCDSDTTFQVTTLVNSSIGGSVDGTGYYGCGDVCTLTAVPEDGYVFCSWTENGMIVSTESTYSFNVTGDRTLKVNFAEEGSVCNIVFDFYTLYEDSPGWEGDFMFVDYNNGITELFSMDGGSSATYYRTVVSGSYVTISWIPDSWICDFDISYDNGVPIQHEEEFYYEYEYSFLIDCEDAYSPHVISAIADPEEGGSVYGAGTYDPATVVTLTAVPNEGYTFMYWSEYDDIVSLEEEYTFIVSTDRDLVAHFTMGMTVSVTTNMAEGGTVTGGGVFDYDATCTLTATANEGYVFNNWTKNGQVVSHLSKYVFPVTESAEYVANFQQVDGIAIGDATNTNHYLPLYLLYCSMSEQIYTADEMGGAATEISSASFYNTSNFKRCNISVYMVHTDKTVFESNSDWIAVTEADRVFNGSVSMTGRGWTTIYFNTPFAYDGVSNVALIMVSNTSGGSISCRTFRTTTRQALRTYNYYNTNIDPSEPYSYSGTLMTEKSQVIFGIPSYDYTVTVAVYPEESGTVSTSGGSPYFYGQPETLIATPNEGFVFSHWTKNGEIISYLSQLNLSVTETADYVAHFQEADGIVIGNATYSSPYLPTYTNYYYSLSQQIYTADELGGEAMDLFSVSFFNTGPSCTRNLSIYMAYTDKTDFESDIDWVAVTETDQVFSGNVDMCDTGWVTITFDVPFFYDGTSNVVLTVDDNSGRWKYGVSCRTFSTDVNQALYVTGDANNYDPMSPPTSYSGGYYVSNAVLSRKNQIIFGNTSSSVTQTTELAQGWNWFSTYLGITLEDLQYALNTALPEATSMTIKSKNSNCRWNGTIWRAANGFTWDVASMYRIEVPEACELTLTGLPINPAEYPITIAPNTSTWIGLPLSESMTLDEAFPAGFAVSGDVIKGKDGNARYTGGQWRTTGNLNALEPGKGYIFNSNASGERTLVFSTGTK